MHVRVDTRQVAGTAARLTSHAEQAARLARDLGGPGRDGPGPDEVGAALAAALERFGDAAGDLLEVLALDLDLLAARVRDGALGYLAAERSAAGRRR